MKENILKNMSKTTLLKKLISKTKITKKTVTPKKITKSSVATEPVTTVLKPIKIVEKHDRNKLSEGRTTGMAFGFLKKISDEEFHTIQPLSPCKDYLNDVIYSERLKTSVSAYGLSCNHIGGIIDGEYSYMGIKIVGYQSKNTMSVYPNLEKETEMLKNNYKHIEKLLNWIEEKIGVKPTKIRKANDGYYRMKLPSYWTENTYLISLYSLITRMALTYDGSVTPEKFLDTYNGSLELSLWNSAKPKFQHILNGGKLEQNLNNSIGSAIHNMGIVYCKLI